MTVEIPGQNMDFNLSKFKQSVVKSAFKSGIMSDQVLISLVDNNGLQEAVRQLCNAFPKCFTHSFAIKANYYVGVLRVLEKAGMSAEVAGEAELELALAAGFPVQRIVYDGPVKTRSEIKRVLELGLHLNIDNFQEMQVIAACLETQQSKSSIGFRINPQIGAGSISLSSTATLTSKFGVGIEDAGVKEHLIEVYRKYKWLNGLHVHVGSVACPLSLIRKGVAKTIELANHINNLVGKQQIQILDIGGGLPVDFSSDEMTPTFTDYTRELKQELREISLGGYQGITEFGRAIVAKNAMTLARVEYTKITGGRKIALTHAGAHNMIRTVFQPDVWARRLCAISSEGQLKLDDLSAQDVAGPCCFSGDIIAHQRKLPLLNQGDFVLIQDTGAYCFSNHFQYNALPAGAVYLYKSGSINGIEFLKLRAAQSTADVVNMYN